MLAVPTAFSCAAVTAKGVIVFSSPIPVRAAARHNGRS